MRIAFGLAMLTFTLLAGVLVWSRARVWIADARLRRLEQEALEFGIGDEE
jgi:hypothetical protein